MNGEDTKITQPDILIRQLNQLLAWQHQSTKDGGGIFTIVELGHKKGKGPFITGRWLDEDEGDLSGEVTYYYLNGRWQL